MAQTADNVIRIQMEIMSGFEWGDPRSKVADTVDNKRVWDGVARDVAAMTAAGITPEVPYEVDLD